MMRYCCDVQRKLDNIKKDLIQWSREHDPRINQGQSDIQLWCSINRLIGAYFPDWCDKTNGGDSNT